MGDNQYLNVEKVKQIMLEKNMSVEELSAKTGYAARTIKKYFNGAYQGTMPSLMPIAIAEALGIKPHDIFSLPV